MIIFVDPVESVDEQARCTFAVVDQFDIGEPEPGMGGRAEEEVLVFDEVREFRRVELQDVAACPPLDRHVEHLARYFVLHARQGRPVWLLADGLGELVLEVDDLAAERDWVLGAGWPLAADLQLQPWGFTDFRLPDPDGYYLRVTNRRGPR